MDIFLKRKEVVNKGMRRKFVFDFRKLAEMKRKFYNGKENRW